MWETYKFWSIGYKFRGDGRWEMGVWRWVMGVWSLEWEVGRWEFGDGSEKGKGKSEKSSVGSVKGFCHGLKD